MEIRLDGRSALITGGSKGLGRAMASKFSEAGADVAILARGAEALAEAKREISMTAKGKVQAIRCDVSKAPEIEDAYKSVLAEFGKIDILVNNAGTSLRGKFEDMSDKIWQRDLDLKLFSAIRLSRLAFPQMKERRWGRILNVLAISAKAPKAMGAPTAVSRAAGLALTKVLAGEGAPYNVLVNALLVGVFVTDQHRQQHLASGAKTSFEEHVRALGATVPLGRMGDAEEFANLACFLVSDAGSYITGTAINVDGGLSPVV